MDALLINFQAFLTSIYTYNYEFPSNDCFNSIPWFFICSISLVIQLKYIPIFFMILSLTKRLFRIILPNIQIYELLSIRIIVLRVTENALYNSKHLEFIQTYFMTQYIIFINILYVLIKNTCSAVIELNVLFMRPLGQLTQW